MREAPADGDNSSFCSVTQEINQRWVSLRGSLSARLILKYAEHTRHVEWEKLCQGKVSTVCRNKVKSQRYRACGTQLPLSIPMKSNPIPFFNNSILNQTLIGLIQ